MKKLLDGFGKLKRSIIIALLVLAIFLIARLEIWTGSHLGFGVFVFKSGRAILSWAVILFSIYLGFTAPGSLVAKGFTRLFSGIGSRGRRGQTHTAADGTTHYYGPPDPYGDPNFTDNPMDLDPQGQDYDDNWPTY